MKVLIVEDDINMRKSLEIALVDYDDLEVSSVKSATQALKQLSSIEPDIIITDINMPGLDGIEFVKELNGKFDVIIMTGNATLNRAIESVRLGVKDFLTKPFDINTLYEAIKRVQKEREKISTKQIKISNIKSDFVGDSEALKRAKNIALKAAVTDASVMIMGESGVGKEVFANFIHQNSKRKDKPFIAINMAAIPENLIESELFGFEKGAFTDATTQKTGLFELANGGTLFLDEIGEMPINLQPKLLRAIQEREISRLGGTKPIKIDVRILCATNANLDELIKNAKFREDLFYRLNTIPLLIPPLRERKDEIEAIANAVLKKVCDEYELGEKSFSDEAISELLGYSYPGNIRELISITQRAAILSEGTKITADDLFLQGRKSR
ncbi:sigma-54-dependent transcriptional regulator [Campylobacter mucosalis]|uniref:Sigma54-dependent response regulator n=1 Tax=Campylobacter mucosalis CCUG 21559 TaxID=1032067 RepID=A0A6G5QG01_9BACT|nr:sigma-54 dependent transcriptional regulator [Campylobacter mucosalis]QCD44615.1 sigma54-dependent response regulator [Campylobacter mucosalis CCUG 21559]